MRFWIVNPFDDIPGEGPPLRYATLCRVLADAGHAVTWWSADFSHRRKARRSPPGEPRPGYELRLLPVRAYAANVSWARFRSHRDFARAFSTTAHQTLRSDPTARPDLLLVSLPPLGTADAAFAVRRACGAAVVVDIMDLWPETFLRLFPGPPRLQKAFGALFLGPLFRQARRAFREADALAGAAQRYLDAAHARGAQSPMHRCYHCTDIGPIPDRLSTPDRPLRLLYLGAMERTYDLETLLRVVAAERAAGRNLTLDLAGGGTSEPALRQLARTFGEAAEVIRFHGFLAGDALRALLASSDVGIVPMDPASGVAVPYKAADYTAAGLAVVSCLGAELDDHLRTFEAGLAYRYRNPASLQGALRRYLEDPTLAARHGQGARRLAETHFDRPREYQRFAEWLVQQAAKRA